MADQLQQLVQRYEQTSNDVFGDGLQNRVAVQSAQRRAVQDPNNLPESEEDFLLLYPNASIQDVATYRGLKQQRQEQQKAEAALTRDYLNTLASRNVASDTANTILKGTIGLGQVFYGAADVVARNNAINMFTGAADYFNNTDDILSDAGENLRSLLDGNLPDRVSGGTDFSLENTVAAVRERLGGEKRGLAQDFQKAREISDELLGSDLSNVERENIQRNQQQFAQESDLQTKEQIEKGSTAWLAEAKNIGRKALNTVEQYINNPAQIVEQTVEEVPQLLLGAGAGSLAAKSTIAGLSRQEAQRFLASDAGKRQLARYTEGAGVGTAAISEAMSNAVETRANIEQLSEKQLTEESPLYNKYREQGLNHVDARNRVADRAFDITAALTLPTAGLASKLTGAGRLEGSLFVPNSKLGQSILKPLGSAAREGVEETIQSGAGQVIQNVAVQQTANENQNLTENVGEAIGQGAVVGAGSGLTLSAIGTAPEALSEATKASADSVDKVLKKGAKVLERATDAPEVKEAVASGNLDTVIDENSDNYNPDNAIKSLLNERFIPIKDEANNETDEQYQTRVSAYKSELSKHIKNKRDAILEKQERDEDIDNDLRDLDAVGTQYFGVIQALEKGNTDEAINIVSESNNEQEVENNKQSILGSMDLGFNQVSVEQAEELLNSGKLSETETAKVNSYIQTVKSMAEVSKDIRQGSDGFLGLNDYRAGLNSAIDSGNQEKATKYIEGLKNLAESQASKATKFENAFNLAKETNQNVEVSHNNKTSRIHKGSNNSGFIDNVRKESDAINQVFNSLVSQYNQAYPESTNTFSPIEAETTVSGGTNADTVQESQSERSTRSDGERQSDNVQRDGSSTVNVPDDAGTGTTEQAVNISTGDRARSTESVPVRSRDGSGRDATLSSEEANTIVNEAEQQGLASFDTTTGKVQVGSNTFNTIEEAAEFIVTNPDNSSDLAQFIIDELNQEETISGRLTKGRVNNNEIGEYLLPSNNSNLLNTIPNIVDGLEDEEYNLTNPEGLRSYINAFRNAINNTIQVKGKAEFLKDNLVQLMISDADYNGTKTNLGDALDSNMVTAMALSSLKWLGTRGADTRTLTDKEIKRSLGLDEGDRISNELYSAINNAGIATFLVTNDLGQDVFNSIGFRVNEDAHVNTRNKVIESIGSIAIAALHDLGLLQETRIPKKEIDKFLDEGTYASSPNQFSEYIFTKVNDNRTYEKANQLFKDNETAFEDLFGMENIYRKPSFSNDIKVNSTVSGQEQKLSAKQKSAIKKQQELPVRLNAEIMDLYGKLGDDFILNMEGYVSDLTKVHTRDLNSVQGKNEAIRRSLNYLNEFTQEVYEQPKGILTPFYFKVKAVSNNRLMVDSNTINYQSDKLHRHSMIMDDWQSTIDSSVKRDVFKLALGQAFGVDIDKQTIASSISEADDLINNPIVTNAVEAIRAIQNEEEVTIQHREAIDAALDLGGEKSHTFAGLVSLLNYSETQPFTSNLFMEVDGITNGTAIALLQMVPGGVNKTIEDLRKVGIYSGSEKSYGKFKENGGLDNYESLASKLQGVIHSFASTRPEFYTVASAVGNILGKPVLVNNPDGSVTQDDDPTLGLVRSVAKNPVMIGNYGAGEAKIINEFVNEVVDKFYDKLTKYTNQGNQGALELLQGDLERATGMRVRKMTTDNGLKWEMTPEVEAKFRAKTEETLGSIMTEALQQEFGAIMEQRSRLNQIMSVVNSIFTTVYDAKVKEVMDAKGFLSIRDRKDILKELEPLMPKFAHAKSSNNRDTFINVTDTENVVDKRDRNTLIETNYKQAPKGASAKSRKIFTPKQQFTGVGARPVVLSIQATDSANIVDTFNNSNVQFMNIFDAVITGVDGITTASQKINEAMFNNNKEYSVYESFAKTLKDTFNNVPAEYKKEVGELIIKSGIQNTIKDLKGLTELRKEIFNQINYTVQYNLENNGFSSTNQVSSSTVQNKVQSYVNTVKEQNNNVLGSTSSSPNNGYSNIVNEFEATASTINGLMNKLRNAGAVKSSTKHSAYLLNLMTNTYNDLINPIKVKVANNNTETAGFYDISNREIQLNINKNTRTSSIEMGADEVLAHEMIHAITQFGLEQNNPITRQVAKLFRDARKVIKPEDLMTANGNLQEAQERWDYIFNNPNKTQGTNYSVGIHEFLAMGVTNAQMMEALRTKVNTNKYLEGDTLLEKAFNAYSRVVNVVRGIFDKSAGLSADKKLQSLVRDLATYEQKAKQKSFIHEFTNKIDNKAAQGLKDYILEPFAQLLERESIANNKYSAIRGLASAGKLVARGQFNEWRKIINRVLYRLGLTENNLIVSILNEMAGRVDENNWAFELARESNKLIDQTRAEVSANIQKHILKQFNRELTEQEEIAITKVLLRTDAAQLTEDFDLETIYTLLKNTRTLNKEIAKAEKELRAFGRNRIYYIRMAKSLASYMVNGRFKESVGLMNAHAISRLVMTGKDVPSDANLAEPIIDKLASLEALRLTKLNREDDFNTIVKLFDEEFNNNSQENGITFTLLNQQEYKKRSLTKLFDNNKMLTVKGYVKEIYNPNKAFIIATESDAELLEKDGYVRVEEVPKDPQDVNKEKVYMFVNDNAGLSTWMAGGVTTSNMQAKGSDYYDTLVQAGVHDPFKVSVNDQALLRLQKQRAAVEVFNGLGNPRVQQTLVPVLDGDGNVANFRYLMKDSVKDSILERDERFSHVLGATEGNFISKINGKDINSRYLEAMYQDYLSDYNKAPDTYSFIGENSTNPEHKELWRLLPNEMKFEARNKFNVDGLYVKTDLIKVIFGQRKFSLNVWAKDRLKLNEIAGNTALNYLNPILKALGSRRAGTIEQAWKEIVTMVKDTIVIKSVEVLLGNVVSNNILLWTMGVPINEIASRQAEAVRYAESYQEDRERVLELEREIKVAQQKGSSASTKARLRTLEAEKAILEDSIERNPVRDLIESGIYQSIIEDVELVNDQYSYKTKIEEWVTPFTDKVPSSVKTISKYAALTQDTKAYKFLRRSTQLSDFAARYALHQTNLENGMTREASLNRIEDVFVNYDLPTHKSIQYLNDIGGLFFTKFFMRIQKIIYHTMVNNPARIIGLTWIQDLFGNFADIADSSVIFRDIFSMFNFNPLEVLDGIVDTHPMINIIK